MSHVKRWQFTLRGMIGYTALVAVSVALWQAANWIGDGPLLVVGIASAVIAANGVLWATFGWLVSGTSREFWLGYMSGVMVPTLFMAFGLLFLFCVWLVEVMHQL